MPSLFDRFVVNMSNEGVEFDKDSVATSALIKSSVNNVNNVRRQVHSQCSHTNFKECRKTKNEELDNQLIEELAANRASALKI